MRYVIICVCATPQIQNTITLSIVSQRLIRMNMPVDENMTVHFNTTLFSLIRESLSIKMVEGK